MNPPHPCLTLLVYFWNWEENFIVNAATSQATRWLLTKIDEFNFQNSHHSQAFTPENGSFFFSFYSLGNDKFVTCFSGIFWKIFMPNQNILDFIRRHIWSLLNLLKMVSISSLKNAISMEISLLKFWPKN